MESGAHWDRSCSVTGAHTPQSSTICFQRNKPGAFQFDNGKEPNWSVKLELLLSISLNLSFIPDMLQGRQMIADARPYVMTWGKLLIGHHSYWYVPQWWFVAPMRESTHKEARNWRKLMQAWVWESLLNYSQLYLLWSTVRSRRYNKMINNEKDPTKSMEAWISEWVYAGLFLWCFHCN